MHQWRAQENLQRAIIEGRTVADMRARTQTWKPSTYALSTHVVYRRWFLRCELFTDEGLGAALPCLPCDIPACTLVIARLQYQITLEGKGRNRVGLGGELGRGR